jgi:V/A-type H+-transporting ATPase subunit F
VIGLEAKKNNAKIAVIGDQESIMIFKALGFTIVYAQDQDTIQKAIRDLAKEHYAAIYITEQAALLAQETIDSYKTMPFPAIIPIPSRLGSEGLGMQGIQQNVEKAIGADIL